MIEELKIIAEIFKSATDGALYAYLGFLGFQLAKTAIIVFPIVSTIKFIFKKAFIHEDSKDS